MNRRLYERTCGAVMWLLVVAVMLATFDPVSARTTGHRREAPAGAQDDVVVKEIHIALIKNVLKLRAEQEPYWIPVENALRNLAQWQAANAASTSALPPTSRGAREYANLVMRRLKRIAVIAVPLRKSLDETQRHDLAILARIAGLEILLASR